MPESHPKQGIDCRETGRQAPHLPQPNGWSSSASSLSEFSPQMDESGHRIVQQHPGTGIPHHTAHTLPHIGFVTMNGTPAAGRLALAERTTRKALPGIFQQRGTLGTEPVAALPAAAIETNHPFRRFLFLFDTGHGRFSVSNDILRQSHIATCRNFRQRIAPTGIIGGRRRVFGSAHLQQAQSRSPDRTEATMDTGTRNIGRTLIYKCRARDRIGPNLRTAA